MTRVATTLSFAGPPALLGGFLDASEVVPTQNIPGFALCQQLALIGWFLLSIISNWSILLLFINITHFDWLR